jgi:hypothetical protein
MTLKTNTTQNCYLGLNLKTLASGLFFKFLKTLPWIEPAKDDKLE